MRVLRESLIVFSAGSPSIAGIAEVISTSVAYVLEVWSWPMRADRTTRVYGREKLVAVDRIRCRKTEAVES